MMPELMNCPHDPEGWCLDCLKTMVPRVEVAAALPSTWYADRPVEFRVKLLVEQWQKLHQREKEVAAALEELRSKLVGQLNEWEFAEEAVSATITKLGLAPGKDGANG